MLLRYIKDVDRLLLDFENMFGVVWLKLYVLYEIYLGEFWRYCEILYFLGLDEIKYERGDYWIVCFKRFVIYMRIFWIRKLIVFWVLN